MSLATTFSRALVGVDAPLVTVETHISNGLPCLNIVGLPETAVKESKERVRSAIINSNLEFPTRRITINLAPADLPKVGGRYDLAIALSILAAAGQLPADALMQYEFLGELALGGELRGVLGVLPAAIQTRTTQRVLIIPSANGAEASMVSQCTVHHAAGLTAIFDMLVNGSKLGRCSSGTFTRISGGTSNSIELSSVRGQLLPKRALQIAAAGGHNILFKGPPGTGKTMLASTLPGILPALEEAEALELAAIRSVASQQIDLSNFAVRPFRSPHHTATAAAMVGGGIRGCPGEVSLAHKGVLFLDELPEFNRKVLEVLREPMESGVITLSRANYRIQFPANFQLVAAMNPCPCGYYGDPSGRCNCTTERIESYLHKISGPLLDRIDMVVNVPRLSHAEMCGPAPDSPGSNQVRKKIAACNRIQLARNSKQNCNLTSREIEKFCCLDKAGNKILSKAMERLQFSARGYHRTLKLARTIADFESRNSIAEQDLLEAISYRLS
ncbi:MAG: YifB family Mg chelatase-like AAA ATPase [Gammaproteobacteria bacterium]|nr:YifB family Mg chelatase-like AAA ATPase [Gammaproteobacteria bacterium]